MRRGLKITFFGSSLVSSYWNGAATYYRGIIRALANHGHEITFCEPDAFERQQHQDCPDPPWSRVVVYSSRDDTGVWRALDEARDSDLIVKCSGVGVFDELLETAVLECKDPNRMAIFWDVDAPATLDRIAKNPGDRFRPLIPRYDMILTYGGGPPVVEAYKALGARVCVPVYNALDPATHHPVPAAAKFESNLAFLGNRLPDRETRVDEFFLSAARISPNYRFVLGGCGWDDKPIPPNVRYVGHVYTTEHNAFNCTPMAVLNVNRDSMARYGFSPPTRIFEAAGVGACLITDEWEGLDLFLEPGREALIARTGVEVAAHLRALSSEKAHQMGAKARQHILAEHTYTHRAAQVEKLLDCELSAHARARSCNA